MRKPSAVFLNAIFLASCSWMTFYFLWQRFWFGAGVFFLLALYRANCLDRAVNPTLRHEFYELMKANEILRSKLERFEWWQENDLANSRREDATTIIWHRHRLHDIEQQINYLVNTYAFNREIEQRLQEELRRIFDYTKRCKVENERYFFPPCSRDSCPLRDELARPRVDPPPATLTDDPTN